MQQLNYKNPPCSPCGSKIIKKYDMRLTKNGSKYLAETGKINIYEKIQSHKDETDALKMIKRATAGDYNAIMKLNQLKSNYQDLTKQPANLMEAMQIVKDSKKAFDNLPVDIKEQFGNSYEKFIANPEKVEKILNEKLKIKKEETTTTGTTAGTTTTGTTAGTTTTGTTAETTTTTPGGNY